MNNLSLYKRNITLNYFFTYIKSIDLTQGIWMIYLASKGLTLVELGMIEGIYHITSMLMETPTGAVADIFGRKWSRILGRVISIIYLAIMLLSNSFWGYALAFVFCALSYNLESGAGEAFVYDSLLELGEKDKYMKITGKIEACLQVASVTALIIGGWIAVHNYFTAYISTIVLALISIIFALFFKETEIGRDKTNKKKINILTAMKKQYIDSFKCLKGNNELVYFIGFSAFFSMFITVTFYYLQNYWTLLGHNELWIGISLAFSSLAGAVGGILTDKIEKKVSQKFLLVFSPVILTFAIFGLADINLSRLSFLIMGFMDSIMFVTISNYINQLVDSDKRATIISFQSMTFSFAMILGFPLFGKLGDVLGLKDTFIIFGFICGIISIVNILRVLKYKQTIK